jgi:hypothetical protein
MLKKKRFTLLVFISLLGFGGIQRARADEPVVLIQLSAEAQKAAADGRFNSLKKIESILTEVSALRQLPVLSPVKLTVISRESLQSELAEKIKTEIPPQKIRGEEALYRQLGMIAQSFDYGAFMLDLYTEQIGGFYDPKTQALHLIEGTPMTGIEQEMLIAHELTHALQDQHYHLDRLLNAPGRKDNDDATLALMSLVEGDATVSSMAYIQQNQSKKPFQGFFSVLGSLLNQVKMMSSFKTFQSAPAFIQESLIFPYQQGSQFVNYFQNQASEMNAIQGLYDRLPQSTAQILHPALYVRNEPPQPVTFNFKTLFPQAEVLSSSVWGELGYRQYLQRHLDWKEAKAAASGWAGDRYGILDTPQGPSFVFASLWDNVVEATEFRKAYHKTLALRTGKSPAQVSPGLWQVQHEVLGSIFLYQDEARVLVLEHVSNAFQSHQQFQQDLDF